MISFCGYILPAMQLLNALNPTGALGHRVCWFPALSLASCCLQSSLVIHFTFSSHTLKFPQSVLSTSEWPNNQNYKFYKYILCSLSWILTWFGKFLFISIEFSISSCSELSSVSSSVQTIPLCSQEMTSSPNRLRKSRGNLHSIFSPFS